MRRVDPELLDQLPHGHPDGVRSRREIHLVNRLMGNHRWLCHTLSRRGGREQRVLELAAGDGVLAYRARANRRLDALHWKGLDLAPPPAQWPGDWEWHQRDVLAPHQLPDADILVANMFLHHLRNEQLLSLGQRLPESCRMIVACEPVRRSIHAWQGILLSFFIGMSAVTYHDMLVSIRAGFVGRELPEAMGLPDWQTAVNHTPLGAYRFVAWR